MKKDSIKNFLAILLVGVVLSAVALYLWFMVHTMSSDYDAIKAEKKKFVGKSVLIGKDTFTVFDYSIFIDSYDLGNGKITLQVDKAYIDSFLIK